jgi:hypothetical protein
MERREIHGAVEFFAEPRDEGLVGLDELRVWNDAAIDAGETAFGVLAGQLRSAIRRIFPNVRDYSRGDGEPLAAISSFAPAQNTRLRACPVTGKVLPTGRGCLEIRQPAPAASSPL